jgi:predicted nucleic acid-binding protein
MKAVSNTTPLRYLIAIEQEHLLGQLFEKVFVPVAVHEELRDAKTPETVRRRGRVFSYEVNKTTPLCVYLYVREN